MYNIKRKSASSSCPLRKISLATPDLDGVHSKIKRSLILNVVLWTQWTNSV